MRRFPFGPPFFAITFAPIFVALLILVPFGPRLNWMRGDLGAAVRALWPGLGAALVAAIAILALTAPLSLGAAGAFALAAWVIAASVIDFARRRHALSIAALASMLAHAGLGVTLLGVTGTTVWRTEALAVLSPGQTMQVAATTLRFDGVDLVQGPNYQALRANIEAIRDGRIVAVLMPERRAYPAEGQEVSDTAIRTTGFSDLYVALGDDRGGGRWVIRAYDNPLAPFIWFGGVIMALGGIASLWSRLRFRFARARARPMAAE